MGAWKSVYIRKSLSKFTLDDADDSEYPYRRELENIGVVVLFQ